LKIFIVSDSHFGLELPEFPDLERRERFFSFLENIKNEADVLVLLGDIFDFWFEYKSVIPKIYFDVLKRLSDFTTNHRVIFVGGNHDMWANGFLESIGMEVYPEDFELQFAGKKIFLAHGDVLRKTDLGGRLTRLIMGNRVSKFLYRLLHPDLGVALAHFVSRQSRVRSIREELKNPVNPTVHEILKDGYDAVVHGHIHYPLIKKFDYGIFMSTGDWLWHFTYGVIDEQGLTLKYFLEDKEEKAPW